MKQRATRDFWQGYNLLPQEVQRLADAAYELLKVDMRHPSLQMKKAGRYWSVRVGLHYRALSVQFRAGFALNPLNYDIHSDRELAGGGWA